MTSVKAGPFKVQVWLDTSDGMPRCVGLDVRGFDGEVGSEKHPPCPLPGRRGLSEVTTVGLRSLSVPRLVAEASTFLAGLVQTLDRAHLEGVRRALTESPGRRYGADHFEEVARIYSANLTAGAPTLAVADALGIKRTAAAKQVAKCRELGLLGPTRQGRAGGATEVRA